MDQRYGKLLFDQLRVMAYIPGDAPITDDTLAMVITLNENLLQFGYTLSVKDFITLAKSPSLYDFYAEFKSYQNTVKAKPMYPDYPKQVMEISKAQYRLHQAMHYFSTYGVEFLFGVKVQEGWLPTVEETPKIKADGRMLTAKVLGLIPQNEVYTRPVKSILGKKENMTIPEEEIVAHAIPRLPAEFLASLDVPFKRNLFKVFHTLFNLKQANRGDYLFAICKHTGDVLKCLDYTLTHCDYHFRTSQKRLAVKLLERYTPEDFRANLVLSGKKAERALVILQYLDYNAYSRSEKHKKAVYDLRNGGLRSWESAVHNLINSKSDNTVDFVAQRPGMMLRMITLLYRNGYSVEAMEKALEGKEDKLSTQTLVTLLNFFGGETRIIDFNVEYEEEQNYIKRFKEESKVIYPMLERLLAKRLCYNTSPLAGKKVALNFDGYSLDHSILLFNDKSAEGGYIRSGLAYAIPDTAKYIRFFVYWNDKKRVDIDLHGSAITTTGKHATIGWNAKFRDGGIITSGDITHSDAAEYIDVDLNADIKTVSLNINLYSGYMTFGEIEECYVGIMAVDSIGKEIQLYNPANCFFTHLLKGNYSRIIYGDLDVKNRVLRFNGDTCGDCYDTPPYIEKRFSLKRYLQLLFMAQNVTLVDNKEDADLVLVMGKPQEDKDISLVDNNFFTD